MSLAETQKLLARLYTDADLREQFLAEPFRVGKEHNLNEIEIRQISEVLPAEIRFFAESLFFKRLREVEKLLPLSRKILDKDFEKHFRDFSAGFQPSAIKKHLEDALQFAEFLRQKTTEPIWLKDLIAFEAARLEFGLIGKMFVVRRFKFDIREILREISGSEEKTKNFPARRTLAIWFRFSRNGKPRHFIF